MPENDQNVDLQPGSRGDCHWLLSGVSGANGRLSGGKAFYIFCKMVENWGAQRAQMTGAACRTRKKDSFVKRLQEHCRTVPLPAQFMLSVERLRHGTLQAAMLLPHVPAVIRVGDRENVPAQK